MPNVRKEVQPESGSKRAADLNESFLAVPGYADDSLLSVVRYVSKVQSSLRKCDFEEFMKDLDSMHKASKAPAESPAARVQNVRVHRQKALSKIEEFPELAAEFDTFLTNSKRLHRQQEEAKKAESSNADQ